MATRDFDAVARFEVDAVTGAVDGAAPTAVLDVLRPVWALPSDGHGHVPVPAV